MVLVVSVAVALANPVKTGRVFWMYRHNLPPEEACQMRRAYGMPCEPSPAAAGNGDGAAFQRAHKKLNAEDSRRFRDSFSTKGP